MKIEIKTISVESPKYPEKLKHIYDPPKVLYVLGNEKILNNTGIAIVGCREATEYGKKAATYFAYNLANKGINIISGLAKGIDSYSHIGALQAKGKTIAVIGSGLDIIYPKENKKLAQEIIKTGGAIITEYPIGTKPEKEHFPARNRIISGLSNSVLVVEAKEKSGSLITADFAMEQGKDVYVVPGNINSLNSVGTNNLIKDGAILVNNYKDIAENSTF
ncbi:MAG: DNA-processing protein DprA [Clostridia bacterium]|nr:DNA-processing protein DprA [Clostridia bacterium]